MIFLILSIVISYIFRALEQHTFLNGLVKHGYKIDEKDFFKSFRKLVFFGNVKAYHFIPFIPIINIILSLADEIFLLCLVINKEKLYKMLTSEGIKVENITASIEQMQEIINLMKAVEKRINLKKINRELFSAKEFESINNTIDFFELKKDFYGDTIIEKFKAFKAEMISHNEKMSDGLKRVFAPLSEEELALIESYEDHIQEYKVRQQNGNIKKIRLVVDNESNSILFAQMNAKYLGKRPKRNV